ncbi:MAG: peptide deformylase [Candidatus Levybacteria bacterium RIFCSPHIGHO2_02_FULL_37_13]|nr:MAG: peptide deformylase [Candidatus Levybacteria bacterium RIFCSPHIGHO2_02_FULL_37_13]OGH38164.1 MAG: peptide deformylase [Candidatus Levybacteria bacterium RIFCSPLOWO2_01_FULL_37_26]
MAVKIVIQAGHPSLKKKNKQIVNFKSSKLKRLQKYLIDTMHKAGLIGIAAPQIAENYMVFVTHPRKTKSRRLGRTDKLRIYINPKITFKSQEENIIYEGCGSIVKGDLFGPVSRPREIEIEATDENGQKFRLGCDGILARVIQHEYDHLMGIEFLEKVIDYRKVIVGKYYRKKIRNSKSQKQNLLIKKIDYKKN